jgi:hypothetical protein
VTDISNLVRFAHSPSPRPLATSSALQVNPTKSNQIVLKIFFPGLAPHHAGVPIPDKNVADDPALRSAGTRGICLRGHQKGRPERLLLRKVATMNFTGRSGVNKSGDDSKRDRR